MIPRTAKQPFSNSNESLSSTSSSSSSSSEWLLFCGGSGSHGIITELFRYSAEQWASALKKNNTSENTRRKRDYQTDDENNCRINTSNTGTYFFFDNGAADYPKSVRCAIPTTDNGGSSQDLIDYFGGPAVGDCRNMLLHAAGVLVEEAQKLVPIISCVSPRRGEGDDATGTTTAAPRSLVIAEAISRLIRYISEMVKILKVREPSRESLQDNFKVILTQLADEKREGGGMDTEREKGEEEEEEKEAKLKLSLGQIASAVHDELLLVEVETAIVSSRQRVTTAIERFAAWEEGLGFKEETEEDEKGQAMHVTSDVLKKDDGDFLLPPPTTILAPTLMTAALTTRNSSSLAVLVSTHPRREPVNYVGASTGNVLLFGMFLEALEDGWLEEREREKEEVANEGALERACRLFWDEVLCVPLLSQLLSTAVDTQAEEQKEEEGFLQSASRRSPHPNPRCDPRPTAVPVSEQENEKGGFIRRPPPSHYMLLTPLPFPEFSVLPAIDYYSILPSGDLSVRNIGDPFSSPSNDRDSDGSFIGTSNTYSDGSHQTAARDEAVSTFRLQERRSLSTRIRLPPPPPPLPSSSRLPLQAFPAPDIDSIRHDQKKKNESCNESSSAPLGVKLRPLPFARLDTLLADGNVVEGQKEFSYGLGPTPHGTPLTSRRKSPSLHFADSSGLGTPRTPQTKKEGELSDTRRGVVGLSAFDSPPSPLSKRNETTPPLRGQPQHAPITIESALSRSSSVQSSAASTASTSKNAIIKGGAAANGDELDDPAEGSKAGSVPICIAFSIQAEDEDCEKEWRNSVATDVKNLNLKTKIPVTTEGGRDKMIFVEPSRHLRRILLESSKLLAERDGLEEQQQPNQINMFATHMFAAPPSRLHIIFSRGSFFTSLGAACCPFSNEIKHILHNAHNKSSLNNQNPTSLGPPLLQFSFILNGTVDRETRMFFQSGSTVSCKDQADTHQKRESVITTVVSTCPVMQAVSTFFSSVLHERTEENGKREETSFYLTNPKLFSILGLEGSKWYDAWVYHHHHEHHHNACQNKNDAEGESSERSRNESPANSNRHGTRRGCALLAHDMIRWLQPKLSAFSSSRGGFYSDPQKRKKGVEATMYDDAILVRALLGHR